MTSTARGNMSTYRNEGRLKPLTSSNELFGQERKGDLIGAWHSGTKTATRLATSQQAKKDDLLRSVDNFLASTRQKRTVHADQGGIAERLYRSEVARDEAQAKLQEWMKVASELQEVVQQQQKQLDTATRRSHEAQLLNKSKAKSSTSDQVFQLQNLVQNVREELERVSAPCVVPALSKKSAVPSSPLPDVSKLQAEIQSLRRQLHSLQHTQESKLSAQNQEAAALAAQVEAQKRAAQTVKGENEQTRSALMDAEMELQRFKGEASALRAQLAAQETKIQGQAMQLKAVQTEAQHAKQHSEELEQQLEVLKKDKAEAIGLAGDATAEAGRLEAECNQKQVQMDAAQHAAEQAMGNAVAADARTAAAEAAAASERAKNGALSSEVARLQSEVLALEAALGDAHRRSKADAGSFAAQLEALQEEMMDAQKRARIARREAESLQSQVDSLTRSHAAAVSASQAANEKLLNAEAEAEAALRRANRAESQLATAVTAAAERDAQAEAEARVRHTTEVQALKEVLDNVATAAQQKDAALQSAQAEVASLRAQCSSYAAAAEEAERKLSEMQAAAAIEFKEYDAQMKAAHEAVVAAQKEVERVTTTAAEEVAAAKEQAAAAKAAIAEPRDPPVQLIINVQDAPIGWQEGQPIPEHLKRKLDLELQQIKAEQAAAQKSAVAAAVEDAVTMERKEHAHAVRALEEAHIAEMESLSERYNDLNAILEKERAAMASAGGAVHRDLDPPSPDPQLWAGGASEFRRAREAAEAEANQLRNEVRLLRDRGVETQARLRATESELAKMRKKMHRLEDELQEVKIEREGAVAEAEALRKRIRKAEGAVKAMEEELADAQDEVETLLTARITQLSRPVSEVDPQEEDRTLPLPENEEFLQNQSQAGKFDAYRQAAEGHASRPAAHLSSRGGIDSIAQPQQLDFDDFNGEESDEEEILRRQHSASAATVGPMGSQAHLLGQTLTVSYGDVDRSGHSQRSCSNARAPGGGVDAELLRRSLTSAAGSSSALQRLPSQQFEMLPQQPSGVLMPPPPPQTQSARQSPLKKLASRLFRGKKSSRRNTSASSEEDYSSEGGEVPTENRNGNHGGAVKRRLMKAEDGSVRWQPNAAAALHDDDLSLRERHSQVHQREHASTGWRENGVYAEYSEDDGDLTY